MKLAWLTDIHMNFNVLAKRKDFYSSLKISSSDAYLISGDIADASSVEKILIEMSEELKAPIYFVLGNHDYYGSSVVLLREKIEKFCEKHSFLNWLPQCEIVHLTRNTALVGQDTWADGRYGNYGMSRVVLNDSRMIMELLQANSLGKFPLLYKMQELADRDAESLEKSISKALENEDLAELLILVHVPPFAESSMHEGKRSDDNFMPFFSSKATGDVLLKTAQAHPNVNFLVLCGHTHSKSYFKPLVNLEVKAGESEYGKPKIQELIEVKNG